MDTRSKRYELDSDEIETSHFAETALVWGDPVPLSLLQTCKNLLSQYYGDRFWGLVHYGSTARRQADAESDVDLLVLLKKPFDYFAELRRIVDLLYPVQLESERLISAKPAATDEYEAGKLQLYRNAKNDGELI